MAKRKWRVPDRWALKQVGSLIREGRELELTSAEILDAVCEVLRVARIKV